MRRVTRNAVALIAVVVVSLLALGALPGLLKSGDPYYVTAEPLDGGSAAGNGTVAANASSPGVVNGTALSERRFPYTTTALASGASEPYWRGPVGIKGAFTHSPFDEMDALERRAAAGTDAGAGTATAARSGGRTATPARATVSGVAVDDRDGVVVAYNGTLYSVAVGRDV